MNAHFQLFFVSFSLNLIVNIIKCFSLHIMSEISGRFSPAFPFFDAIVVKKETIRCNSLDFQVSLWRLLVTLYSDKINLELFTQTGSNAG